MSDDKTLKIDAFHPDTGVTCDALICRHYRISAIVRDDHTVYNLRQNARNIFLVTEQAIALRDWLNAALGDSANPEYLNAIHNIDQLDPDADYISGLRPKEPVNTSKDSVLGCGDYLLGGD